MITLITGSPGSGKTAFAVAELAKAAGRPIFVDGIPELAIPHEQAGPLDQWHTWAPDGALIVADEVQRTWRPRPPGSKVSDAVAALETHRHRGIDFLLITQAPSLVDQNVRRLVSRHVHIVATWAARFMYEWPECNVDPLSGRTSAIKVPYKLPKSAIGKYKSAEIHTKQKRRVPPSMIALGLAVVVAALLSWRVAARVSDYAEEKPVIHEPTAFDALEGAHGATAPGATGGARRDIIDFKPRIEGRPETAPAYDKLRQVRSVPIIAGCVLSEAKGCQCYTQQATRYDVPDLVCREIVDGNVFNPYAPEGYAAESTDKTEKDKAPAKDMPIMYAQH